MKEAHNQQIKHSGTCGRISPIYRSGSQKKNTNTQLNNTGIKPIGIASAGKGVVYEANQTGNGIKNTAQGKTPYIPISVVTGDRDITTVPPKLRTYLLQGAPSATSAIPTEYADVANVLEKAGDVINFENWADMTAKQQLNLAQKAGLSEQDKQMLLNSSPRYVETISKIQDVFANRYELGISFADARNVAKELIDIANEREEAYTRTGKYEMDAVFAPKVLRWLEEQERKLLDNLTKNAGESGKPTWYNGENSEPEEDKETSADIHRRAKYADIDEAEASKQIEAQIMKNIEDAKALLREPTFDYLGFQALDNQLNWFKDHVSKNKPMDYKNPAIWYKTFPDLPYPKEDKVYNVFGYKISSSDLGNLNYAMVGKALEIPELLLLQQAGAAQLQDHEDYLPFVAQIASILQWNRGYGDQLDDQRTITNGFNAYDLLD
jgi:Bacterial toxin 44